MSLPMTYRDEHLAIHTERQMALLDGQRLRFTEMEFRLLAALAANEGEIAPRSELLRDLWGYSARKKTRTIDVHVRRLRKKLGPYADSYIETIFGVGYRFRRYATRTKGYRRLTAA